MITAPLPRASPSRSGRLSMIIPRYYGPFSSNSERLDIRKMVARGMERDRFSRGVVVPAFCQDPAD